MYIDFHTHYCNEDANVLAIENITFFRDKINSINPQKFYSVGIHPWYIRDDFSISEQMKQVKELAINLNILCIGETGLDKIRGAEWSLQLEVFKKHIELSEMLGKPLVIHCVKAFDVIFQLKKQIKPQQKWIIHGFQGKAVLYKQVIDNGLMVSISKKFFNAEFIEMLDKNSFFLETDDSQNSIVELYQSISLRLGISVQELENIQKLNFSSVFGNPIISHQ
ncbi:MAG TPA: TatD family hydrolase [Bacteroidales bacterium]|nr:TatD family hydrolase [Bacteroidales bacterium]